jgi:hypothetical protein
LSIKEQYNSTVSKGGGGCRRGTDNPQREKGTDDEGIKREGSYPFTEPLLTPKTTDSKTTISLAKLWTSPRFVNRSSRVVSKETFWWTLIGKMREWIVKEGKAMEGGIVIMI